MKTFFLRKTLFFTCITSSLFFSLACKETSTKNSIGSIEKYRKLRTEKLNKPRKVIHNNDGCDVIYFPVNEKYTIKNLLDKRTSGLIGTDVSTISVCPIASGFGNYTYNTQVGDILLKYGFELASGDSYSTKK